ncbi:DUF2399 domain-containing protein [Brevibacillus sp. SYP-B805]|uniref:TIGR02679 domain-containing protein n=1 Tax=Brevibacillus sp. SYP-B805 TaxID=1578199 RepID=UPI0013EC07E3|nr:TIGR02679 domain-containing protein [Brevibacillus sp. SYP-B805]NGQ95115.1 DUF2399 domain-containing protein [Brevibacillus sp. SYP-B805]
MDDQRMNKIKAFFSEPGLTRFIDAVRNTYRRRGVSGYVRVKQLSAKECEALEGLLGTLQKPGEDLQEPLRKVENILLQSGFDITIRELLTCLDGQEVLTRAELEQQAERNWNDFIDAALQAKREKQLPVQIGEWVERLREGAVQGSRILRRQHAQNPEDAQLQFEYCLDALCRVWEMKQEKIAQEDCEAPEMLIRLPVLAAKVARNAHAFDIKFPAGRLLWCGLQEIFTRKSEDKSSDSFDAMDSNEEWESSGIIDMNETDVAGQARSLEIRKTYRIAGIADDDISSQVILFAPHLTKRNEELVLTLRQVERLPAIPKFSGLYVVENPSVFATLLDGTLQYEKYRSRSSYDSAPILICLNGQPSAATIRWIDRCLEARDQNDVRLHYSGDFDVKGLAIAQGLARRYGKHFVPWRMSVSDYERFAPYGMDLSDQEKEQLQKMTVDWDYSLGTRMAFLGTKVHQEVFVEELLQDWMDVFGSEV